MWIRRTFRASAPSLRLLAALPWCLLPAQALAQAPTDDPTDTPDAAEAPPEAPAEEAPAEEAPAEEAPAEEASLEEAPTEDAPAQGGPSSEDAADPQAPPADQAETGDEPRRDTGDGSPESSVTPTAPAPEADTPTTELPTPTIDEAARDSDDSVGFADPSSSDTPPEAAEAGEPEEEIFVAGARLARTPGSAHVIGRKQLERFEYDDSQAILLQVPGVYVRQEDGIGLRPNIGIRGVSPDRSKKLTLMEDGILFGPAPYSAPAAYFFPLMTRMGQVQVIKGPSAIAHGPQTVGGAIDFISRPIPTETSGGLDLGLGDFGYSKAHGHFGSSDGQTGFLLEGVRL